MTTKLRKEEDEDEEDEEGRGGRGGELPIVSFLLAATDSSIVRSAPPTSSLSHRLAKDLMARKPLAGATR